MGKIFAGIEQKIGGNMEHNLVLKNFGNLPALFQWDEKLIPDHLNAIFEPARGTIPPHSEIPVRFIFTVYTGGDLSEFFTCDIADIEFPLTFELKADVFGLSVSYEAPDEM
jgi:hypothetical protein